MSVVVFTILGIMAMGFAFCLSLGLVGSLQALKKLKNGLMPYFFYALFLSNACIVLFSTRSFSETSIANGPEASSSITVWAIRLTSVILGVSIIDQAIRFFRENPRIEAPRAFCLLAFAIYWVTNVPVTAAFAPHTEPFQVQWIYPLALVFGMLCMHQENAVKAIETCRNAIILFCLASVLLIFIQPGKVLDTSYVQGYLPGVPRFAGLAPHAITLGICSGVAMWCLLAYPLQSSKLNKLAWVLCAVTLFLTQAKAVWFSFILGTPAILIHRYGWPRMSVAGIGGTKVVTALVPIGVILGLVFALCYLLFGAGIDRFNDFVGSKEGAQLMSLTGRDRIWAVAVQEWQASPVFGYGLSLFDFDYRKQINMPQAIGAHSQFYDTIGRSGSVGLLGLAIYYLSITVLAFKYFRASRGLSVALLIAILVRSVSEVPVTPNSLGIFSVPYYLLTAVIAAGISVSGKERVESKRAARVMNHPSRLQH